MLVRLAMDYRQWLLATTFAFSPDLCRQLAFDRRSINAIKSLQEKRGVITSTVDPTDARA